MSGSWKEASQVGWAETARFWPLERSKVRQRRGQWRCGECGKVFHAEHFLDRHAERAHLVELVPPVRRPRCNMFAPTGCPSSTACSVSCMLLPELLSSQQIQSEACSDASC